ncbi:hypothetical protein [Paenibacillus stellifer]|uniref:hypothetical protein n=1 Tax=Paenibacillus stellifer TaxID=169760 RepID=UPI0012EE41F3|nr:hypothetical protein [Paenibacillus stellifer]
MAHRKPKVKRRNRAAKKFFRGFRISLSEQAFALKRVYPDSTISICDNKLVWTGELQPTELSCVYKVQMEFTEDKGPSVQVLSPKLQKRDGKDIPHMYRQKTLCLYYPKLKEWRKIQWLHKSIIPWTTLWLYFYEIWLLTGKWEGKGIHPPAYYCKDDYDYK